MLWPNDPRTRRRTFAVVLVAMIVAAFQNCTALSPLRFTPGIGTSLSSESPAPGTTLPASPSPAPAPAPAPNPSPAPTVNVPLNPFGIGVAYVAVDQDAGSRAITRGTQMALAAALIGKYGRVRIWCATYSNPGIGLDAVAECAAAINLAYQHNLVPIINMLNPYPAGPDDYIDPGTYAKDTTPPHVKWTTLAKWYANFARQLPRKDGFPLYIEFGNEQNFTDWWVTQTCYFWIRAAEYAEALAQVADQIHAIGDPRLKVLTGALAAYSDSDPQFKGDGTCARGGTLGLSSADFAKAMYNERPDVFGAKPKIDGWNSHPYPSLAYGHCSVGVDCPAPANDPTLYAYRSEMANVGVPTNFPVFITEMGYSTISGSAQWVADSTVQAYPTWLNRDIPYNNVQGVTGYLLGNPGDTYSYVVDGAPQPVYSAVQALRRASGYAD